MAVFAARLALLSFGRALLVCWVWVLEATVEAFRSVAAFFALEVDLLGQLTSSRAIRSSIVFKFVQVGPLPLFGWSHCLDRLRLRLRGL